MTTITLTRKLRIFDWDKNATEYSVPTKGFRAVLLKGKLVRRENPLPAEPRINVGICPLCGQPVMANKGQIIIYAVTRAGEKRPTHKPCRKAKKY